MTRERGILFSAPMVRAILAGAKTQTRRMVKSQPPVGADCTSLANVGHPWHDIYGHNGAAVHRVKCPYGQPGDKLWVRETWAHHIHALSAARDEDGPFVYAADGPFALQARLDARWTPAIHMFRWASRITLEVTEVRVERLQSISEADAAAEGVHEWARGACSPGSDRDIAPGDLFGMLWASINGYASWNANPWAWCVSFRRAA